MNETFKIVFFEVKDWEIEYIHKAFGKTENVILVEDRLTEDNASKYSTAQIISTFISSDCSFNILSKFSDLKFIATRSTGYDHIDLSYCKEKGIEVSNVPNYGQNTVAEHAMALLLAVAKRLPESLDRVKNGKFIPEGLTGVDLKDKIVGVVGTGNIGRNFIKMANGFGMSVIAYDVKPNKALEEEFNFTYVDLKYLFAKSDVISLHIPYLESTHHIINRDAIKEMKPGVIIINTSRGGLIDTDAIFDGLKTGKIGGAGIDVLEEENFIKEELELLCTDDCKDIDFKVALENHMMTYMPNVVVTPHNAFNTHEALVRIVKTSIENIQGFLSNKKINLVSN